MPLNPHCVTSLGESLLVRPFWGYGWVLLYDSATKEPRSFKFSELPQPFVATFREPTYIEDELVGGVGYIGDVTHEYFRSYLAFFAWLDHEVDFAIGEPSFQAMLCREYPIIEPQPKKPFAKWLVNQEALHSYGFIRIHVTKPLSGAMLDGSIE